MVTIAKHICVEYKGKSCERLVRSRGGSGNLGIENRLCRGKGGSLLCSPVGA